MTDNDMRVSELRRYPVKSMAGERLDAVDVTERGFAHDREYGLVDVETGKVVSAKRPKRWARLLEVGARGDGDRVVVDVDGDVLPVDDPALPARLSAFLGRNVAVLSEPPPGALFEEAWEADLKGGIPPFLGNVASAEEDGDIVQVPVSEGMRDFGAAPGFYEFGAVHLVTTSSLRALAAGAPASDFHPERFRPNIVVETDGDGFLETDWQGKVVRVGGVAMDVQFTVPRCVMTTLAQAGLPVDRDVLRTITKLNRVEMLGTVAPCVGVYAQPREQGTIRLGDEVRLDG
jgi:uncharacterized protein YcbX